MKIAGTGSALPGLIVTNDMLTEHFDTSDEWIVSHTGIRSRHIMADDETLTQLASAAALRALENAGMSAEQMDMILCSTVGGDYDTPALACAIQGEIRAACPCVDLNAACSGFVYALDMADAYISSGKARHILIVCAEALSRISDWTDRSTTVLFGDGAAAVVVSEGDGLLVSHLSTTSNTNVLYARRYVGNNPYLTEIPAYEGIKMMGQDVYRFAVSAATEDIQAVTEKAGVALADIDHFLLHQANMRIIRAIRQRLHIPEEKLEHNIERTGNTSSVSIPLLLDELNRAGRLKQGELLAMSAFGAGLTTGAAVLRWTMG